MKPHLLLVMLVLFSTIVLATPGIEISCEWFFNETCPVNTTAYLRMHNFSANLSNGHAQLINYTVSNYSSILCCNASPTDYLKTDGIFDMSLPFIKLSDVSNAHVEDPDQTNYAFPVNFDTTASYVSCGYYGSSCPIGYNCIYSIQSSGSDNRTNAHIGDCDAYPTDRVCCDLVQNITAGGTLPPSNPGGGGIPIATPPNCSIGQALHNMECIPIDDTGCEVSFTKSKYNINESVVLIFDCPDLVGRAWEVEWLDANQDFIIRDRGIILADDNQVDRAFDYELDGVARIVFNNEYFIKLPYVVKEGFNLRQSLAKGGVYLVLFVVLLASGIIFIVVSRRNHKKKKRLD